MPRGEIEPPTQGSSVHDSINKNLNNELFLKFDRVLSSEEFNDLVPNLYLAKIVKNLKDFR